MKRKGMDRARVLKRVLKASREDVSFANGRVFGSMCTEPHEIARRAHGEFWEANLGNPGLCPGTQSLEREVVSWLGRLYGLDGPTGRVLSGGTESNITALWMARKATGRREVVFARSAHFSIRKAVELLDMTPVEVGLDENYRMDLGEAERAIGAKTAAVVAVAGTTELGMVDPISELGELCSDGQHLHVDAAFGGFVLPFFADLGMECPPYDFSVPAVTSLSCDPHKMGRSTIPSGVLLARDAGAFERISVASPYLTSLTHTSLLGTRASGAAAATWAVMARMGREGYAKQLSSCMDNTRLIA